MELEGLGSLRLTFLRPWWLLLLPVILPPLIVLSARSLAGLGRARRAFAIFLRTAVLGLIVAALADPQLVRRNEGLTTLFVIDASRSIPGDLQAPMLRFINDAISAHRRPNDKAGVIAFGKDARVESPPAEYTETITGIESRLDTEYTDIGAAIKLALATFPEDTARRIVLLSDGNENRGDAYEQALAAAGLNVQIDALPIDYRYDREVLVEKVSLPADVKKGETVNITVVVNASAPTRGILQLNQTADNSTTPLVEQEVTLRRGVNVFKIPQVIDQPNFYTYSAQFIPGGDVLIEEIALEESAEVGEEAEVRVTLSPLEAVRGELSLIQRVGRSTQVLETRPVELEAGRRVVRFQRVLESNDPDDFSAVFVPEEGGRVDRAVNNYAEGFTQFRGEANVLLIEGVPGEHQELIQALRENELNVTARAGGEITGAGRVGGDPLPTDLAELQKYDAVILANIPKDAFTDAQQDLIATAVHDQGIGLIMIGGEQSFGAGGWMNSPVEEALPVDMQIPALKVKGKAALVMIMHASEIAEGNYWQKVVAQEALKTLSSYDYAGLLHWQGQESWLFTLREIGASKQGMLRAIDRMTPGDMPDFNPSLLMALRALQAKQDAMTKHMVIISDGDPTPPTNAVMAQLAASRITVTTVMTAAHGNDPGALNVMQQIARRTKGRFYNVTNPRALPRIYQKEARLISRPLIFEGPPPSWTPNVAYQSEPILGVGDEVPPISGFVLSSVKENELVEVPILSPVPTGQTNPVLAHWSYGLGRSVAFTSDAGRKWAAQWPNWESYSAFWSQIVRWALRPVDQGNLTVSLRREEGQIKVVVDALDAEDEFLNFLEFQGNVNRPDRSLDDPPEPLELVQTLPGRYEGVIENAEARGNYFVTLGYRGANGEQGVVTTGLSVPYSDEYRDLRSNPVLLETLSDVTNGQLLSWVRGPEGQTDMQRTIANADVFRRDPNMPIPRTFRPIWHLLLWTAAVLFLFDVAVRRIAPDIDRIRQNLADMWQRLRGQDVAPREDYMEKLRSRKAEVGEQIDRGRAATRFEAPEATKAPPSPLQEGQPTPTEPSRPAKPAAEQPGLGPQSAPSQPESYTNRLLQAKRKVWEEQQRKKDEDEKRKRKNKEHDS